jgi:hypothetical protein
MSGPTASNPLPEARLNGLLREVDWRFLLRQHERPRTVDLTGGRLSEALGLVTEATPQASEGADLVVLGFPGREQLRLARKSLRPGGEVVCLWQRPHPLGVRRARARLERAGFGEARFYWPGPSSAGAPEFWLPIDAPRAIEHVLSGRPVYSRKAAVLRRAWRLAARSGTLAPICAVARLDAGASAAAETTDAIDEALPAPEPWVLLTGGEESDNKVVGLPFNAGPDPKLVAKFARVPKAGAALEREAELLQRLETERPGLSGVPWLRASGHRAGGRAIVQGAMHGKALSASLNRSSFGDIAPEMTRWLISLAGKPAPQPASSWSQRLVFDPLEELERDFGDLVPAGLLERARRALSEIGDLPLVWEHRDLGPWNVVIDEAGAPAVIDWEDADPEGLPGLDLFYLLASSTLLIDGALDDTSRADLILKSYAGLLDPGTPQGKTAAACIEDYRAHLGIGAGDFRRLRLLCWIVQLLIAFRRLPKPAPGATTSPGGSFFTHLVEDELRRQEGPS